MAIPWVGNEFDQVRWAIDSSLTDDVLPTDRITSPIYGDAAGDEIEARLSTAYADLSATDQAKVRRTRVLLTAAYLCPAVPALLSERSADGYQYQRQSVDWAARAADLRSRAEETLASVLEPSNATHARPTFFTAATGTRGR